MESKTYRLSSGVTVQFRYNEQNQVLLMDVFNDFFSYQGVLDCIQDFRAIKWHNYEWALQSHDHFTLYFPEAEKDKIHRLILSTGADLPPVTIHTSGRHFRVTA